MSTKHFFPSTEGVVLQGLESLVARNTHLALDRAHKVVYSTTHTPSKVAIISGGGSGHEPAWSGYVGDGMLAAAVNGEVFASPSTKQIMAAIRQVPSDVGVILCITNYTGDNLHFGLAREKAAGMGYKIDLLRMTDDVALGREKTEKVGRRGLAANVFVLKLCGTAADEGYAFEECMKIGTAVNANAVTVGSSLDHCHIPGREHHRAVPPDAYVLGMGIHNEPGLYEIAPMPTVEELIRDMLGYCLDADDADRAFVEFWAGDVVLLMVNNFGGMSTFELEALTHATCGVLQSDWKIVPRRIFAGCFESSLNAPGWSISLLNVSGVERECGVSVETILDLLDRDTTAPAWPKNGYREVVAVAKPETNGFTHVETNTGPTIDNARLESALRTACAAAIDAEPDLTRWDIQMGDGDCGEAVVNMCNGVLTRLDSGLCSSSSTSLFYILDELGGAVEDIGGSLAAIISILLASFTTSLRQMYADSAEKKDEVTSLDIGAAAKQALTNLQRYTSARVGGRTVMDALIPFCDTIACSEVDLAKAVAAAEKGAEATGGMKAKFGRATYVGENADAAPPDPGAMAAAVFLRGLEKGFTK